MLHPTLQETRQELEARARMWREHQRRQQGEPVQQQVWSRPAPLPAPTPDATWASLPTPVKAAVVANWAVISRCAPEIDAQVAARHRTDIAAVEEALASVEALETQRMDTVAEAAATAAGEATARAREALQRARAEGEAAAEQGRANTTRLAVASTAGASSSEQGASSSFPARFVALEVRLGPALGTSDPVTGQTGGLETGLSYREVWRTWRAPHGVPSPATRRWP